LSLSYPTHLINEKEVAGKEIVDKGIERRPDLDPETIKILRLMN
jgi:hypothetical protein